LYEKKIRNNYASTYYTYRNRGWYWNSSWMVWASTGRARCHRRRGPRRKRRRTLCQADGSPPRGTRSAPGQTRDRCRWRRPRWLPRPRWRPAVPATRCPQPPLSARTCPAFPCPAGPWRTPIRYWGARPVTHRHRHWKSGKWPERYYRCRRPTPSLARSARHQRKSGVIRKICPVTVT